MTTFRQLLEIFRLLFTTTSGHTVGYHRHHDRHHQIIVSISADSKRSFLLFFNRNIFLESKNGPCGAEDRSRRNNLSQSARLYVLWCLVCVCVCVCEREREREREVCET